jgi:DNA replication protein DnaC
LTDAATATTAQLIVIERYGSSVVVVCPYCDAGRRRAVAWSGLPDEAWALPLPQLRAIPEQREAVAALAAFTVSPRGWITLAGSYGTGKTALLCATLVYLASVGVYGRYTTAPDLLNHLRDALRDADGRAHSERLERLKSVPVLVVDELDKYRATEYAEEAIFTLFDHRYRERATLATLIGYNRERGDRIPPFLASRIRDGRFRLVHLDGADLRPAITDDAAAVWARGE